MTKHGSPIPHFRSDMRSTNCTFITTIPTAKNSNSYLFPIFFLTLRLTHRETFIIYASHVITVRRTFVQFITPACLFSNLSLFAADTFPRELTSLKHSLLIYIAILFWESKFLWEKWTISSMSHKNRVSKSRSRVNELCKTRNLTLGCMWGTKSATFSYETQSKWYCSK